MVLNRGAVLSLNEIRGACQQISLVFISVSGVRVRVCDIGSEHQRTIPVSKFRHGADEVSISD